MKIKKTHIYDSIFYDIIDLNILHKLHFIYLEYVHIYNDIRILGNNIILPPILIKKTMLAKTKVLKAVGRFLHPLSCFKKPGIIVGGMLSTERKNQTV